MADQGADDGFLLAILNSTPVVGGVPTDDWADQARARAWLARAGGSGPQAGLRHMGGKRQGGVPPDDWADQARARAWLASAGGSGTEAELRHMVDIRQVLQAVVRGQQPPDALAPALRGVTRTPAMADGQISWTLTVPAE